MMSTAFGLKATPMTVAAGMSATFDVEFKPPMAGDYGAKITIDFDDTINPRFIIQVTGKGVLGNLSVSPMTLDFGGVYVGQRSEPKAVKLKNIGTTVVDMIDISTPAGDNTGSFRQSMMMPIKTALMPGEETDVYYVFEPRVPSETLGAKVTQPMFEFSVGHFYEGEFFAAPRWHWGVVLAVFTAVSFGAQYLAQHTRSKPMHYAGLALYTVAEALIFVPLLAIIQLITKDMVMRGHGDPNIIRDSAFITLGVFGALVGYQL